MIAKNKEIPALPAVSMSLRDYFAGQALTGVLASPKSWSINNEFVATPDKYAVMAYSLANAMMEEREE